jgi:hypothetical protein
MDRTDAKDLLHIKAWLERAAEVVTHGKEAYLSNELLQEAGDSLMMKLGEAANRLARRGVTLDPPTIGVGRDSRMPR